MGKITDLSGKTFHRWTVLSFHEKRGGRKVYWHCSCACGALKSVEHSKLTGGGSKSCGCLSKDHNRTQYRTHGEGSVKTKEYRTWVHIRSRCHSSNNEAYPQYGGRGIYVCDR